MPTSQASASTIGVEPSFTTKAEASSITIASVMEASSFEPSFTITVKVAVLAIKYRHQRTYS